MYCKHYFQQSKNWDGIILTDHKRHCLDMEEQSLSFKGKAKGVTYGIHHSVVWIWQPVGSLHGDHDLVLNQVAKPWSCQYLDPAWYHLLTILQPCEWILYVWDSGIAGATVHWGQFAGWIAFGAQG